MHVEQRIVVLGELLRRDDRAIVNHLEEGGLLPREIDVQPWQVITEVSQVDVLVEYDLGRDDKRHQEDDTPRPRGDEEV